MSGIDRREFLIQTAGALGAVALMPSALPAAVRGRGEPLGVGLIGMGRQSRAIIAELQKIDAAKIVAVCDTDASRLEQGARRVEGAATFSDHKALLEKAKNAAAVIIATPTHLHRQIALDAISSGRHVYCEAPMAATAEDARAMAAAARGIKTVFQVGLEGRCNPVYKLARTFFRSDSVREVVTMRGQSHQKTTWRVPASDPSRERSLNWRLDKDVSLGLAGEIGSQQFDVFCWYRDQYPVSVRGYGDVAIHKDGREVPDTIGLEFAFADGRKLAYDATLGSSYGGREEVLCGVNATIRLMWTHGWMFKEADAPTQGWEVYASRQRFHEDEGITLIADATKLASQGKLKDGIGLPNPPLYYALADFVRAATEGSAVAAGAEEGLRASLLAIIANQAAVGGKPIEIKPEMLK